MTDSERNELIQNLQRQMDEMLEHPNGATVGDLADLQKSISNLLQQQEAEKKLYSKRIADKERCNAAARLVAEP